MKSYRKGGNTDWAGICNQQKQIQSRDKKFKDCREDKSMRKTTGNKWSGERKKFNYKKWKNSERGLMKSGCLNVTT